jgi:hypothetical protein
MSATLNPSELSRRAVVAGLPPLHRIGNLCPPGMAYGLTAYGAARECRLALARAQRAWRAHQAALQSAQSEGA